MAAEAWTREAWGQVDRGSAKFVGRFRFTIEDCLYSHGIALGDEAPAPSTSEVDVAVRLLADGQAGFVAVRDSGGQEPVLLFVRVEPHDGDEPVLLAHPVGECRYCGRFAPLRPGVDLARDWREGRFSISFGLALIEGEPDAAHRCRARPRA